MKLRGFRIELAEIESVLRACPAVRAAAVTVREDTPGIRQLIGYVVPAAGEAPDETVLRARLRRQLPDYMIPALIEPVATLPVLPSGKVDRRLLPPPRPRAEPTSRRSPIAPRTPREQRLAAVWAKLFAPAPVSVQDNFFFDLGGHSLLAARMVSELRQEPQWQALSMLDVYRHPTLESLATAIESAVPVGYLAGSPLMGLYCRLMGARIGRNVHLDADGFAIYDLLEIGDDASVGVDAILPPGTVIGDNCRIGCLSLPPPNPADALREDTAWLGSPALFLPQRQRNTAFTEAQTFQPPLRLRAARAAIEFVRILLPTTDFSEFDLVRIGDDVALNNACTLQTHLFEDRVMKMSTIEIAARARVGTGTLLLYDTRMEAGSSLGDLSLLMKGETLPAGTRWEGIPARVADTNRSTPT